jgi:hypothetical protein
MDRETAQKLFGEASLRTDLPAEIVEMCKNLGDLNQQIKEDKEIDANYVKES